MFQNVESLVERNCPMDISIIIPVYNVSEYLLACLKSVAIAIRNIDAEVLLIDDGSTDDSGEIAKEFILENPAFYYYFEENQGLGRARNYGVELAKGKYLIVLDSDDKVEPDMFENMFSIAEKTQSELTICNVSRFNSKSSWASSLHQLLFHNMPVEETTHITRNSALLYDTTAWNKLILRSFYTKHAFRFPENHILYEDLPVTLPMHYLANHVACVRKAEYLWRVRDGKTKSITQSNTEIKNITDRLTVLKSVFDFYRSVGNEHLLEQLQIKVLKIDLIVFVNVLDRLTRKLTAVYVQMLNEFIDQYIDKALFSRLSVIQRQKYECLIRNDIDGIKRVLQYAKNYHSSIRILDQEGRFFFDLPDDVFALEDHSIYVDYEDIEPNNSIDSMEINNDVIDIDAHLFYPRIDIRSEEDLQIEATLVGDLFKQRIPIQVQRNRSSLVTEKYGAVYHAATEEVDHYCYDGAGFHLRIDLNALADQLLDGENYYIECRYKTPVNEGISMIRKAGNRYYGKYSRIEFETANRLFSVFFDTIRLFFIHSETKAQTAELSLENDGTISFGKLDSLITLPGTGNEEENSSNSEEDVTSTEEENAAASADEEEEERELSVGEFLSELEGQDSLEIIRPDSVTFDTGKKVWRVHDFYVYAGKKKGNLLLQKCSWAPVWKLRRTSEDTVEYELSVYMEDGPYTQATIYIDDAIAGVKRILSTCTLSRTGDRFVGRGSITFDAPIVAVLYSKNHRICVSVGDQVSRCLFWDEPFDFNFVFDTMSACLLAEASGTTVLKTYLEWGEGEKTRGERKYIRETKYKEYRNEPLRDNLVMFEAKWGAKYNDNPRAFYEYLDAHHPEYQCVWSFKDPRMPILGNGHKVRRGSDEYYHYLATAKYLINDVNFEDAFVKRDGQIMVETMHGTPFKSFGLDVEDEYPTKSLVWKFTRKTMNWDYLVSQGAFVNKKAYPMLRFYKTILKTGYPRTDKIITGEGIDREALKRELNIPADRKVILYVPTFRIKGRFSFNFDFDELMRSLGDEYVFAVRVHYMAPRYKLPAMRNLIDLTAYSNIEDLYQIADILVTDYSSAMFDFALTGKPMIFYVYDLKEYEENLRGVYMDLRKEAPGPLVYTQEELVGALKNMGTVSEEYSGKVDAFLKKYLTHERADSSESMYNEVFIKHTKTNRTKVIEGVENWIDSKTPAPVRKLAEKMKIHLMTIDKTVGKNK